MIKIHTLIPDKVFKPSRLIPTRSNIIIDEEEKQSPNRNNAILEDLLSVQHLTKLHSLLTECTPMIDAILLFKVWLRQRNLDEDQGINGFLISMLMLYLIKNRQLNLQMSSYQLFRVTLNYLSTNELLNGITLSDSPIDQNFKEFFPIVFLDHTGRLNLTSRVSLSDFKEIQHEAKISLSFLQENATRGFQFLFLQEIPFNLKFDQIFQVKIPNFLLLAQPNENIEDLNKNQHLMNEIQKIFENALSAQIPLIICKFSPIQSWKLNESPSLSPILTIGILVDPTTSYETLERGPSAEDKEKSEKFSMSI